MEKNFIVTETTRIVVSADVTEEELSRIRAGENPADVLGEKFTDEMILALEKSGGDVEIALDETPEPLELYDVTFHAAASVALCETVSEDMLARLRAGEHPAKVIPGFVDDILREIATGSWEDIATERLSVSGHKDTAPADDAADIETLCLESPARSAWNLVGSEEGEGYAENSGTLILEEADGEEPAWDYKIADGCDRVTHTGYVTLSSVPYAILKEAAQSGRSAAYAAAAFVTRRLGIEAESVEFITERADALDDLKAHMEAAGSYVAIENPYRSEDGHDAWDVISCKDQEIVAEMPDGYAGEAYETMQDLNMAAYRKEGRES